MKRMKKSGSDKENKRDLKGGEETKNKKNNKKSSITIGKLFVIIFGLGLLVSVAVKHFSGDTISYNKLVEYIEQDEVENITIGEDNEYIFVKLKDGNSCKTANPDTDTSNDYLYGSNVEIHKNNNILKIRILCAVIGFVAALIYIKIVSKGVGFKISAGNGLTKIDTSSKTSSVRFKDIAGNEESKEQMMDIVTYLKDTEKFKNYGVKPPKGVIFYGPPGTGKTLMAKALAGEASCEFISVNGADFVDKFVGNGAARVRDLFAEARKKKPCIIFIDEIDAIGGERNSTTHEERHQTLNSLLGEIDGFKDDDGIIVIAATNRIETLDKALLRSGRFDTKIQIELPDINAREKIFKVHSKNKPISDFRYFAKLTTYFSGADIENIMNKAGLYAIKSDSEFIEIEHIDKAINTHIAGDEKKDRSSILEKDKMLTAVHEVGHAIVAKKMAGIDVNKITIIPTTTGAGGYTLLNEEEVSFKSKEDLYKRIAVSLGGRAAEEVIYGKDKVTTGAAQDIKNVTNIVENMIRVYGMSSKFGMINLERYNNLQDQVVQESREIVDKVYEEVIKFLEDNKSLIQSISDNLMETETLSESQLTELLEEAE